VTITPLPVFGSPAGGAGELRRRWLRAHQAEG